MLAIDLLESWEHTSEKFKSNYNDWVEMAAILD